MGAFELPRVPDLVDLATDEFDFNFNAGDVSLREAIAIANVTPGADVINFAPSLIGQTITLGLGEIAITDSVTVNGLGADQLTVSANLAIGGGLSRIFHIDDGNDSSEIDVNINDLTLANGGNVNEGGAIWSSEDLFLHGSYVVGNQAETGGGIYQAIGELIVTFTTVSGNSASGRGGGIALVGTFAQMASNTITGNDAVESGGGMYVSGGIALVEHTTITNNTARDGTTLTDGGGLHIVGVSTVELDHTIVAGNTGHGTAPEIAGEVSASYSLVGSSAGAIITNVVGNFIGTPISPIDPLLAPLEYYGGPTPTHAPLAFSLAIDGGNPAILPPLSDQREFPREVDGDSNGSAIIDIGSFEKETTPSLGLFVDLLTDELDADRGPGDLSLREAIEEANNNFGLDTIGFRSFLAGQTLALTLGELAISDDVVIDGIDAPTLTIDAGGLSRIFLVDDANASNDADVDLRRLRLTGGAVIGNGGAIFSRENLSLFSVDVFGNTATGDGGGIYAEDGSLTTLLTTIDGNTATTATGDGGGIFARLINTSISKSTVSGNDAGGLAGGVFIYRGTANIENSTISGNDADSAGGGINSYNATTNIDHSTITLNTADDDNNGGAGVSGGGVRVHRGTVNLENTIVADNRDRTGTRAGRNQCVYRRTECPLQPDWRRHWFEPKRQRRQPNWQQRRYDRPTTRPVVEQRGPHADARAIGR